MANKLIILFNDTNDISSHIDPSLGVFRQGDVGHEIYCHFENFANYSYGAYIMFERADGSKSPELPMTLADFTYSGTLYSGFKLVIDDEWIMAQDGSLKATVRVRNASGTVVASGLVPISLEKTVYDESPNITVEQYNAFVAMLEGFITDDSILYPHVLSSLPEDLTDFLVNSVLFITNPDGSLTIFQVVASGEDKVLSDAFVIDSSLIKETFSPTNYTPTTSTTKGHFVGIDNELDDIITGDQVVGRAVMDEAGNSIRESYGASLYTDNDDVALKIAIRNKLNAVLTTLILREATTTKNGLMSSADKVKLTDLPTKGELDIALAGKADKATTLSGYGIIDAYTKTEADNLLDDKADLVDGKVPSSQLPSYVDDVLEYANLASFPATGSASVIYVALDTNLTYRWSGSAYIEISPSLALGETAETAYRGDMGKTAYDHSQVVSGNPHNVTKGDVGLGNVDNTSDEDKPISTATQTALDGKADNLFDDHFDGESTNPVQNQVFKNQLLKQGKNWFSRNFGSFENGFLQADGSLTVTGDYATSPFVYLKAGTYTLSLGCLRGAKRIVVLGYNLQKQVSSSVVAYTNENNIYSLTFTILSAGYIRFCSQLKNENYNLDIIADDIQIESGSSATEYEQYYLDIRRKEVVTEDHFERTSNLVNPSKIEENKIYSDNGGVSSYSGYSISGAIKVKANKTYTVVGKLRNLWMKKLTGENVVWVNAQTINYQITPEYDGYIGYSIYAGEEATAMVVESSEIPSEFVPYGYTPKSNVYMTMVLTEQQMQSIISQIPSYNVLKNKKYIACGDSFTEGGYTADDGYPESYYKYQDVPYQGKQKTYPFILGLRNDMTVVNMAISGRTIASTSGNNSFTASEQYKQIPADADYITIKFGINDAHQNVPLGNLDNNTDITTFYGAWNVVMTWIITNRPTAKIGIIITNGTGGTTYPDAIRNIAEKYGIPYLDEVAGKNVPLLNRVDRSGVAVNIQTIRDTTFRISATNGHPNVVAQEYESTFVENFLRTL